MVFTDLDAAYRLTLRNGVLIHRKAEADPDAAATITTTKPRLLGVLGGDTSSPGLDITGDAGALTTLLGVLDQGDPNFDIVTP